MNVKEFVVSVFPRSYVSPYSSKLTRNMGYRIFDGWGELIGSGITEDLAWANAMSRIEMHNGVWSPTVCSEAV